MKRCLLLIIDFIGNIFQVQPLKQLLPLMEND